MYMYSVLLCDGLILDGLGQYRFEKYQREKNENTTGTKNSAGTKNGAQCPIV